MSLLEHPKRYHNGRGIKMASFLSFECLTFWYPFVLVLVWVPPIMDAHVFSLRVEACRLLCDMLSARDSGDGVGHPKQDFGTPQIFHRLCPDFCETLEHLLSKCQNIEGNSAESLCKYLRNNLRIAPKNQRAKKICAQKSTLKVAHEPAHQNQRTKSIPTIRKFVSLEDESQKKDTKTSVPILCQAPAPT